MQCHIQGREGRGNESSPSQVPEMRGCTACWKTKNNRTDLESQTAPYSPRTAAAAAAAAKSLQSCLTLCDPIDSSPPGSAIPGILQARTLEWVVISFFNAWKWKVKVKSLSRVWLLATPWTAAYQAPPFMEFSRQEYWSGVPLLPCTSTSQQQEGKMSPHRSKPLPPSGSQWRCTPSFSPTQLQKPFKPPSSIALGWRSLI